MEGIQERAAELGITLYVPSFEHDAALARWYKNLIDSGEFEKLFTENYRPLTKFMQLFQLPTTLVFAVDEIGEIWATMWFFPFDHSKSAIASAWVREDHRGTEEAKEARNFCYKVAFNIWDTLISITRQEGLLGYLRRLGYNIVGSIPNLLEGKDAWFLYLTKENYKEL